MKAINGLVWCDLRGQVLAEGHVASGTGRCQARHFVVHRGAEILLHEDPRQLVLDADSLQLSQNCA